MRINIFYHDTFFVTLDSWPCDLKNLNKNISDMHEIELS